MMKKAFSVFNIFLITLLIATPYLTRAATSDVQISLSFTNLADPGEDHYEGWLIVDGSPVSTGKFTVDSTGKLMDLDGKAITSFSVNGVDLDKATKFVLSLELKGDTDSTPNSIKPLAGDLSSDKTSATLMQNTGADFSAISGKYILATPTDGADTNENSGIWFLSLESGSPAAGLVLPDLTGSDWTYEGWVVINGVPVTSGTFDKGDDFDNFDGFSSTMDGPPFPGEDYLVNAPSGLTFPTDLAGMKTVISVEPRMDNSAAPFMFKPLVGDIASTATDHMTYDMMDMSANLPTGSVSIEKMTTSDSTPLSFLGIIFALATVLGIMKRRRA